ncbi:S8 family serine peptidase [Ottowia sp.]|uniref:S8 family peptidase n=1 Tax=Ottowia sp. TaxID=1898956 RepID=UPI002C774B49|nr:S8 family serine peptidase [Ottowia sp.]HNR81948.1 S8 family serine peptidase [Ottowia sp.]
MRILTAHLLPALALGTALLTSLPARATDATVARGLIVTLKAPSDGGRESPQATRERLRAVAADAGLGGAQAPMPVGPGAHLLPFAAPLTGTAVQDAERRVRLNPQVASVEPDVRLKRLATPNDPYYTDGIQWHLRTPAEGGAAALNLPPAWERTRGSAAQVVAVVDSGALYGHPDLAGKLLPGYDLISDLDTSNDGDGRDPDASDPGDWITSSEAGSGRYPLCPAEDSSWHGSFIAGEIAAATHNGVGVAGVGWDTRVQPVRVSGKCGAWLSDVVEGIRWAAGLPVSGVPTNPTPARVINVSFGGSSSCNSAYQTAIDDAGAAGSLVVVAAGNENGALTRPADCAGVLAVGAARQDGLKTYYSSYGPNVGIMAPGGPGAADTGPRLYSTSNAGLRGPGEHIYDSKDGTSFASPLAAGVAALMLSVNPALTPAQLISRIQSGARPFPSSAAYPTCRVGMPASSACNCTRETCGPGLLDAEGALRLALSPSAVIAPIGSVPAGSTVTLDGRGSAAVAGASIASYQWSQVSGSPVGIRDAGAPVASVSLPDARGDWVFRLLVTDSEGRAADNYVTVSTFGGDVDEGGGTTGPAWGAGLWALALGALWHRRTRRRTAATS